MNFSEELLRTVVSRYDDGKQRILAERDERLRAFHENGWRPVDLQRVTGYSRETIRYALHPEIREAANASRRKPTRDADLVPEPPAAYGAQKPYVVADQLRSLRGPTEGTITLPHHLDWSGRPSYDLGRPTRLASMYRAVLNEAGTVQDLRDWLNRRVLIELWPTLWLPQRLRHLWENKFPELAARRPAVA